MKMKSLFLPLLSEQNLILWTALLNVCFPIKAAPWVWLLGLLKRFILARTSFHTSVLSCLIAVAQHGLKVVLWENSHFLKCWFCIRCAADFFKFIQSPKMGFTSSTQATNVPHVGPPGPQMLLQISQWLWPQFCVTPGFVVLLSTPWHLSLPGILLHWTAGDSWYLLICNILLVQYSFSHRRLLCQTKVMPNALPDRQLWSKFDIGKHNLD